MKLADVKLSLVESFFNPSSEGILVETVDEVIVKLKSKLSRSVKAKLSEHLDEVSSSDVTKAFGAFARLGDETVLTVVDDDTKRALFAAVRRGKQVVSVDLTETEREPKTCDLKLIKEVLKQAKSQNEDVYFTITTGTKR